MSALPIGSGIVGVLGFGLFKQGVLTLDYPAARARYGSDPLVAAEGRTLLALDRSDRIPAVTLSLGGHAIRTDIDSGSSIRGLVVSKELADTLNFVAPPTAAGRARTVEREIEIFHGIARDPLMLGSIRFDTPSISYPALRPHANLGSDLLSELIVSFDQVRSVVGFERHAKPHAAALPVPEEWRRHVGVYGIRTIGFENGALTLQRQGGPRIRLEATDNAQEFDLVGVPAAKLRFVAGDKEFAAIEVLNPMGQWERSERR
jgi:hypothetical protein